MQESISPARAAVKPTVSPEAQAKVESPKTPPHPGTKAEDDADYLNTLEQMRKKLNLSVCIYVLF